MKKQAITLITVFILFFGGISVSHGEVLSLCWNVKMQSRPDYVMKLAVTGGVGNFFTVQSGGFHYGDANATFSGTVQILPEENKLIMSLNETHSDNSLPLPTQNVDQGTCQYILDANLNGTGWCSGTDYQPQKNTSSVYYGTGTITFTECP